MSHKEIRENNEIRYFMKIKGHLCSALSIFYAMDEALKVIRKDMIKSHMVHLWPFFMRVRAFPYHGCR